MSNTPCLQIPFASYAESVPALLDALKAGPVLAAQRQILIKPNLVNASPPPVTTPPACCEALIAYIRRHSAARVVIAEGCGAADMETDEVFRRLGYAELAARLDVELVDLNRAPLAEVARGGCRLFPSMRLPKIAFESFILSVPVLKAHSLAVMTGTLKNMMGFAPPADYQQGGHWKKSAFHRHMHAAITELNRYVTPALTVLDGRVGLAEYHLGGAECDPPARALIGGFVPLAVDRCAAGLLGLDWRRIPHLG
jgi:uncharacterized protein (DUF362 family)